MKAKPKKSGEFRVQAIKDHIKRGYSGDTGFLHIPKTGGSSLNAYGKSLVARGYKFPCIFGHSWKAEQVLKNFPKMRLSLILRDPVSRMISGFNSRLRQGRPTYDAVWTPGEAAAFLLFPSVRHLLDAILEQDDYQVSALTFAMKRIRHLNCGYRFYFKNAGWVREHRDSFRLVGTMESVNDFVRDITLLSGAPEGLVGELYSKRHESKVRTEEVLDRYSDGERARIREFLSDEYEIYQELLALTGRA